MNAAEDPQKCLWLCFQGASPLFISHGRHTTIQIHEYSFTKVFFYFFNVYLFLRERETETESEWGRSRERGRQNLKQTPGSEVSAQSLAWGLNP